jgi:glyoxylase-like metal-dependent hydrolase (beta-lactamase superfamily II)
MLSLTAFTFNPFAENTYLVWDEATGEAAIIDPGMMTGSEEVVVQDFIVSNDLKLTRLLLTHGHIDHVLGCDFVRKAYGVLPCGHTLLPVTMAESERAAQVYGIPYTPSPQPATWLKEGDSVTIGDSVLEVREAPGHARCHIVFIDHDGKQVIGGDVLFKGSVGRMDLPGGNGELLFESIKSKLYSLPDDYVVHSGHGEPTTIGWEARNNPFVRR